MASLAVALFGIGVAAADSVLTNADIPRPTKLGAGDVAIAAMVRALGEPDARARDGRAGQPGVPAAPGSVFRDRLRGGGEGPAMAVIPAGRFRMGCQSVDEYCYDDELPVHEVTIAAPFALSVHEVTFDDYDRFMSPNRVDDHGWGRGRRPVINVSWTDAKDYVAWLSAQTGAAYRLPSESEWEYAARAGTATNYDWGDGIGTNRSNCQGCGSDGDPGQTVPVASFRANAFGLHDMHGNVWEWVEDCWNGSYEGAPADGSAWLAGDCRDRVLRGGSWHGLPRHLHASLRLRVAARTRDDDVGFRVARTLTP